VPSENQSPGGIPLGVVKETIGIFSLLGVGLGLTGGITISQLAGGGGGIFGGILVLVVLTFAFLIGPLVAVITGLRIGEEHGQSNETYIAGGLGAVGGYLSMMLIVLLILSLAMSTLSGDAGTGTSATQSASTSGSGLDIGEYILPVIAVAIPTAITGSGGVFFAGNDQGQVEGVSAGSAIEGQQEGVKTDSALDSIPLKKVGIAIAVIAVIGAGVAILPGIISPSSAGDLVVNGDIAGPNDEILATGTIENPTDQEISTTVTYEFVVDGETVGTSNEDITVPANSQIEISHGVVTYQELEQTLTEQEQSEFGAGNFQMDFIIQGETVDSATVEA